MIEIKLKTVKVTTFPKPPPKRDQWGREPFPLPKGRYTIKKALELAPDLQESNRLVALIQGKFVTTVSARQLKQHQVMKTLRFGRLQSLLVLRYSCRCFGSWKQITSYQQ